MSDTKFTTGAVRSADAAKFSFTSLPMIGLLALARTAGEGGEKYGRFNYLQGMPLHDLLEHVFKHLVMFNAGDRSETHLAHAAWGLLVAIQEDVLRPEAHVPHMLGPGCSITPAMQAHMDAEKPILAKRRAENAEAVKLGEPDDFTWNIFDLSDVQKLRGQRDAVRTVATQLKINEEERQAINEAIAKDAAAGNLAWSHEDDEGFAVIAESKVDPSFGPGSTNEKVYGTPTRTEEAVGIPTPRPGERWTEYDDGTRAYFQIDADHIPRDAANRTPRTPSHRPVKVGRAQGNLDMTDLYGEDA